MMVHQMALSMVDLTVCRKDDQTVHQMELMLG
jgi:hypothetical protein